MMSTRFDRIYDSLAERLIAAPQVDVGEWHAQDVRGVPQLVTRELRNEVIRDRIPHFIATLQDEVQANQPFAEAQFKDRVSGEPLNPPPSADLWPYAQQGHAAHLEKAGGKFSHTYPERMWPKFAGLEGKYLEEYKQKKYILPRGGIRYSYGDLQDVVNLLARSPHTRQAYLPIWFPEDTGNVENVRLPCSLGYHFLLRDDKLHCTYFIRSVDFVRHFRDDFYMAARLCQWVLERLRFQDSGWNLVAPGELTMHMISLHCMEGDLPKMKKELKK